MELPITKSVTLKDGELVELYTDGWLVVTQGGFSVALDAFDVAAIHELVTP